jgi:hypothetical protein
MVAKGFPPFIGGGGAVIFIAVLIVIAVLLVGELCSMRRFSQTTEIRKNAVGLETPRPASELFQWSVRHQSAEPLQGAFRSRAIAANESVEWPLDNPAAVGRRSAPKS